MAHVGYLGPEKTFAHLVAIKRFGTSQKLVSMPTVGDVFDFVGKKSGRIGIVPIENSSGGTIYETVDCLVDEDCPASIVEELSIRVNLALLGRAKHPFKVVYSHFAPLYHCEKWLKHRYPQIELRKVASTALAVQTAASEQSAAALGTRQSAREYGLDILMYPVAPEIPNVTQFFAIGSSHRKNTISQKMSLVASLSNTPGSLFDFLEPFKLNKVNLTRILSRPVIGHPNTYVFFVDINGTGQDESVKAALAEARCACKTLRCVGTYSIHRQFQS
jgi:chorismate mutase / prephenate dehydratase